MKTLKLVAALALPVLFATSCGGVDELFGDGGTNACPSGTTVYRVANGAYSTMSVTNLNETCGLGLTAAALMTMRTISNDTTAGTVTIASADGSTILGTGPVRCNSGTLTYQAFLNDGTCQYQTQRSSQITVSADNTFSLQYTETRSQWTSVSGMNCTKTAPCSIQFTLNMKM